MYKLLIFDLGGVALKISHEPLIAQACRVANCPVEDVQRAVYDEEMLLAFELGQITPHAYYTRLKERLSLPWTYEQFVLAWNSIMEEEPDVIRMLRRLGARYTLTALSNTNALHLLHIKTSFSSLSVLDHWVASCEVGLRKPDPRIYELALARTGAAAHEAVYVDDRPDLVEAGQQVGLTAIRFESAAQLERELGHLGIL